MNPVLYRVTSFSKYIDGTILTNAEQKFSTKCRLLFRILLFMNKQQGLSKPYRKTTMFTAGAN